jgi:iron-sulfur cluster repair protein YtfE (RIC family)
MSSLPMRPMLDLKLLADDHTLLASQVVHIVALLGAVVEGQFHETNLQSELAHQIELLRGQLIEHFEFEEDVAFPRLAAQFSSAGAQLRGFVTQHDQILDALEELRSALRSDVSLPASEGLLAKAAFFESAFELHATSETQLFKDLASRIGKHEDP